MAERPRRGPDQPTAPGRRQWLGVAAGALVGLAVAGTVVGRRAGRRRAGRVSVAPSCTGCTGCVTACPTGALLVAAGSVEVRDESCNSCGYCAAVCPVGALRVNHFGPEGGNGG